METVYYTLTAWGIEEEGALEQAVGAPRRVKLVRRPRAAAGEKRGDNVIDLAAWRAAREAEEDCPGGAERDEEPVRTAAPAPRPSRRERLRSGVLFTGELLATLSVIAVAAALLVRILVF